MTTLVVLQIARRRYKVGKGTVVIRQQGTWYTTISERSTHVAFYALRLVLLPSRRSACYDLVYNDPPVMTLFIMIRLLPPRSRRSAYCRVVRGDLPVIALL